MKLKDNIEVIKISLNDDYISNFDTYEKINNIWGKDELKNVKKVFIPSWKEIWNNKKKENNFNYKTAVEYCLKQFLYLN